MASSGSRHLRQEARQIAVNHLSGPLEEAGEKVVGFLESAVDLSTEPVNNRRSRLVFVDAERGCGKTTLWKSLALGFVEPNHGEGGLAGRVRHLSSGVVWLPELDLDSGFARPNPLAALLVRVERVLGSVADTSLGREALSSLERFSARVVHTTTKALDSRLPHLDSDGQSQELMDVERNRLDINGEFNQLLELALCALDSKGCSNNHREKEQKKAIFVLPIDDFDLDPFPAASVLRMVRAISVPRLFVLIHGSFEMLLHLVEETKLMDRGTPPQPNDDPAIRALSREIGAEALRKHLPPGQRVHLKSMAPASALDFKPEPAASPLRSLLPTSLRDLVGCSSETGDLPSYQGLDAFRVPVRHVYDLWTRCEQVKASSTGGEPFSAAKHLVTEHALELVREDSSVKRKAAHVLLEAIEHMRRTSLGGVFPGISLRVHRQRAVRLSPGGEERELVVHRLGPCDLAVQTGGRAFGESTTFVLRADAGTGRNAPLVGALILLHDLVLAEQDGEIGTWLSNAGVWDLDPPGRGKSGLKMEMVWGSVSDLDSFRQRWNKAVDQIEICQRNASTPNDDVLTAFALVGLLDCSLATLYARTWVPTESFKVDDDCQTVGERLKASEVAFDGDAPAWKQIAVDLRTDAFNRILVGLVRVGWEFGIQFKQNQLDRGYYLRLRFLAAVCQIAFGETGIHLGSLSEVGLAPRALRRAMAEGIRAATGDGDLAYRHLKRRVNRLTPKVPLPDHLNEFSAADA